MNASHEFLRDIRSVVDRAIPAHVIERAKISLLDYLGVTVAGAASLGGKLDAYFRAAAPEAGEFPAIGTGRRLNLKEAVFLNGLNAHALDLDDGSNRGIIHLGSPLFSVLLPLAQRQGTGWEKFYESAILGYETAYTLAVSIQPMHKERGYHATATCGVPGIALAVAHMLDYGPLETENAFAAACASATGFLNVLDDGSELKPYNVAKTALLGLIAAQMAEAGFKGPADPLAGERGFLKMMAGSSSLPLAKPLSDGRYAIEKTYTKPYAACRYCHPAMEAAIRIKDKHRIPLAEITGVEVRTYQLAVYGHDHQDYPTSPSAKMSIPYGVALALTLGKAGLEEYDSAHIGRRDLQSLASKVRVVADQELTRDFPHATSAVVKVTLKSGLEAVERIDQPKGEPENPMTEQEFKDRLLGLLFFGGWPEAEALAMYQRVMAMDADMCGLFELL